MRSLTTIIAAIAIALSTCVAVNAAPQGNTSADRQLRQLEARYDTLSNLRYTNAYIEAEKRVIEAKIEKIKHQALSAEPTANYSSSNKSSSQGSNAATGLEITGPTNINKNPDESPTWSVECGEFIRANDDYTFLKEITLFGKPDSYPMFSMDISNLGNIKLHQINLSVWNEPKDYSSKLTFDSEEISINVRVIGNLKEEFKETDCASMLLLFAVEPTNARRVYTALTSKTLRSMTIGDVLIPLDQFTDSKVIFRALLNRLGTKVSKARDL